MRKRIITFLSILLFPLLLVIGFSSWIIVGEGSATVGKTPITGTGVAYIGSDKSKLYTSIEGALYKAKSGEVVNVLLDADAPNKVISKDCTVKAGVTLNIPYIDGVIQEENSEGVIEGEDVSGAGKVVNSIIVKSGVKIENYGTIIVGGQLARGSNATYGVGYTSGNYSKLTLEDKVVINNYSGGIIQCCGYILESSTNNNSKINVLSDSSLKLPFILMDFRGGNTSFALYSKFGDYYSSPFNQFELRNIDVEYEVFYGGNLYGYTNIYVSSTLCPSLINLVGDTDDYFVSLKAKDENGNIVSENSNNSAVFKYNTSEKINYFTFKGGATINKISLTINFMTEITLSTEQVFLPFSWRINVKLEKYPDQTSTAYFYAANQKIKLMTGTHFEVGEGCTFISTDFNVYSFYRDKTNAYSSANIGGNVYPNKSAAVFKVYGNYINKGTFGGVLIKENNNTQINISKKATISSPLITYEPFYQTTTSLFGKEIASMESWLEVSEYYDDITISEFNLKNRIICGVVNVDDYADPSYSTNIENDTNTSNVNKNYFVENGTKFIPNIISNISKATYTNGTTNHTSYTKSTEISSKLKEETFAVFVTSTNVGSVTASITISGSNSINIGESTTFGFNVSNSSYTKSVIWESSDPNVATIDNSGLVKGLSIGTTTIKAYSNDGDRVESNILELKVIDPNESIPATSVSISVSGENTTTSSNEEFYTDFVSSVNPTDASGYSYQWKFKSNTAGAKFDGSTTSPNAKVKVPKNTATDNSKTAVVILEIYNYGVTEPIISNEIELTAQKQSSGGSCLLPNTLVTMADGTKKPVEQIQPGDMLKVFNHYTGEYDVSPVVFNDSEPKQDVKVINLEFSNGSNIGVVYEHGFFDLDLMKYVYIDEYNYNDYIGHRFYSDGNNIVTLNRAYITTQYTEVYSPVTAYHLNYFTEDILSMPGGIEGLFNIFEYDDDLKYNEELMKQDIEKYGLYTYEDFKDYCSYEFYQAFPAEYLKVAVGKGYITFDEIIYLINRYKNKV